MREKTMPGKERRRRMRWNSKKAAALAAAAGICLVLSGCGKASPQRSYVDLDLSAMSGTVVYAEVFNIMMSPEQYVGKTLRMSGTFAVAHDLVNGHLYTSCVIQDATACCSQGIEFEWAGEHAYPEDYPQLDSEIEVCGTFEQYEDENGAYYHVANASLDKL